MFETITRGFRQARNRLAGLTELTEGNIDVALREAGDGGTPVVMTAPESPAARVLAHVAAGLAHRSRGLAGRSLGLEPVQH